MTTQRPSNPMSIEQLTRGYNNLVRMIKNLEGEFVATRDSNPSDMTLADRLRRQADREIPFTYRLDINIVGGSTTRVESSILIEQMGAFLLNRIYFCWRPTAGANAGKWCPISSGNATIASGAEVAGTAVPDVLDFQFEWVEGTSKRGRQNQAIPSDIMYRGDLDGVLQCPDVFIASSTVTVAVAPTVGPDNHGTLSVVLEGVQLLSARP